jgi:hypothetical protein
MQNIPQSKTSENSPSPTQAKKRKKDDRINLALRDALYMHSDSQGRWRLLGTRGATDAEIWYALKREFGGGGSSQTEAGDQYSFQGGKSVEPPKFWFSCGTYFTDAKPTLAGARLVKRVRELLEIPQLASSETVLSSNDPASPDSATGAGESDSQKRVMNLAFLADLEDEQKGRWATLQHYDALLAQSPSKKENKRLLTERRSVLKDYDRAWDEAVKALDNDSDIVQEVRDRVETEGSTIVESGDASRSSSPLAASGERSSSAQDLNAETDESAGSVNACTDCGLPHPEGEGFACPTCDWGDESDVTCQANTFGAESQPLVFTKEIEVELADSDYKAKSRQLAFLRVQIEELQAEKKQTDEGYKQKIGGLEEQCSELFRSIRRGRDTLELEVYERRDFDRKVVETVHADTQAVVESRPMLPRELQQPLPSI